MSFDMIKALEAMQSKSTMLVPKRAASSGTRLGSSTASYSGEAVRTPTLDSQSPQNASQEPRAISEWEYTQELNKRIDARTAERNAAAATALRGTERRLAIQNGLEVYTPYKAPRLTEEEEHMRDGIRNGSIPLQSQPVFDYAQNSERYKRNLVEWEFLKQERPWHAEKWPLLVGSDGKGYRWESCSDPEYRGTETAFLEYARIYQAQGIKQHAAILPVWIAGAKEALGILELKEKQEAVRTEILIEGREAGIKSMHAMSATKKKNCSGAELTELCQVVNTQPLGMFPLSTKQMQIAEQRNLLKHPMPMHDELQYCVINWLLFDMPRYTAFKELSRSLGRGNRSYIDDMGTRRLLATGKPFKGMPEDLTEKE